MTLRKQNTKQTTRHKLTRAVKPLFKRAAKAEDKPVAKPVAAAPEVIKPASAATAAEASRRVTVSSIAREAKKASRSLDVVSPGKPLPSASARPVITTSTPVQADNTLAPASAAKASATPTVIDVSRPMIRKRTMMSQPPTAMAASDSLQVAGDGEPSTASPKHPDIEAPIQATGRPAKPLLTKPVAAGPTVAELLSAKQQSDDDGSPVTVTAVPTATVSTASKTEATASAAKKVDVVEADTDEQAAEAEESPQAEEPTNPKPQLVTLGKPKTDVAPVSTNKQPEVDDKADEEADDEADTAAKSDATPAATPAASKTSDDTAADKAVADIASTPADDIATKSDDMGSLQGDVKADKPAETPPPKAELYGGRPVIIIHEVHPVRDFLAGLLVFIIGLAVLAAAVNFLLDADIIKTGYKIPHTNMLDPK